MTQQLGGFLLSVAVFGLLVACLTADAPWEWFRK
jgi:hypothetical protein